LLLSAAAAALPSCSTQLSSWWKSRGAIRVTWVVVSTFLVFLLYFSLNLGSWVFFFSLGSGGLEFLEMGFGELFQIEVIWKERRDWINVG
jgi:hypothetical protein